MSAMGSYSIEPRNRFFEMVASILRHEINPRAKVTFLAEVDLSEITDIRQRIAENGDSKPSYTAFVIKALALAMRDHPYANRRVIERGLLTWGRPRIQRFEDVDIAVAVERQVPKAEMAAFIDIVRKADELQIAEINAKLHDLAESDAVTNRQWREYSNLIERFPMWLAQRIVRLPVHNPAFWVKYRGGAGMVSSPGKYGVDTIFANWWAPLAISFGVVKKRPIVKNDEIVACPTFILTVNFDVRIMAGAQAAMFGRRMIDIMEHASTEMAAFL